jgi:hypothetical protein
MESRSNHGDALRERPLDAMTVQGVKWLLVLSSLAVLAFILKAGFDHYSKWIPFSRISERGTRCWYRLQAARPQDIPSNVWGNAVVQTNHAWCNVCYAPDYVDATAMSDFVERLEYKLDSGPVTLATLYWAWDELERIEPTGRYGTDYVARHKPAFLESLGPQALKPEPADRP